MAFLAKMKEYTPFLQALFKTNLAEKLGGVCSVFGIRQYFTTQSIPLKEHFLLKSHLNHKKAKTGNDLYQLLLYTAQQ